MHRGHVSSDMGGALEYLCHGWCGMAMVVVLVAWVAVGVAKWAWLGPRRLERVLRSQGLRGTKYRLFVGDIKEMNQLLRKAQSKPISPLSHCIIPRIFPFHLQAVKRYGKMPITWFGTVPGVTVMDPELIREILFNKHYQFERVKLNPLARFLTTGFTTLEGEKWARHRKIVSPAFHVEKLKCMLPAFSICCDELIRRWEKLAGSEGSCELDIWPQFQSFTSDVISRTAFGSSYEEGREIFLLQAEQAKLLIHAIQSLYIPGSRFLPTKKNNRRREIYREIRGIMSNIIKRRERDMRAGKDVGKNDLLGLLMESNLAHSKEDGGSKNIVMTTDEVIEECKLFYFAGQETTSTLLTWTMVALSMHPYWQVRAREEVMQVFGSKKPEFEELNSLKTVTMILYEVLRLYPPVAAIQRKTCREVKLGEITFPPQVQLFMPTLLVHHDTEHWGEDASKFRPDRFAEGISKASKSQGVFFPFGGGQRVCIGQNFALLEAKMGLIEILQRFSFELSPTYTHAPQSVITLQPQHGAQIILHKL